jgi:hypothetical protein
VKASDDGQGMYWSKGQEDEEGRVKGASERPALLTSPIHDSSLNHGFGSAYDTSFIHASSLHIPSI